ncbi:MAG: ribonuclease E inhibitor RraB [Steroidobacteraceae bacterium]
MRWLVIVFILVAFALLLRIYFNLRRVRMASLRDDWDARQISHLRSLGSDPFKAHEVDFFFGLPGEAGCEGVRRALEPEGFTVDVKPVPEAVDQPFSLHASKSMRLSVPDMQELSRRFRELAALHGGRYDGWAAGVVPQADGPPAV